MNPYEKTTSCPEKSHVKESELIVPRAQTGSGIVPVPIASLENLTTHNAFGRTYRKVLLQWWRIIISEVNTALDPSNKKKKKQNKDQTLST